ncbi:SAM-dependent methyltransferase [Cyanobium sp. Morenito 9A2]|nr:SAM-dependent methyltransferase [Cyanobium sp. Morenito 9A2]
MDWALHDPEHGAYGAGRLRIGPCGDFATAPSLGPAFAELLAPQLVEWLESWADCSPQGPISLVEAGPGEGQLALDLAQQIHLRWPALAARLELVLVEPNGGMAERQHQQLASCPLPVRWTSFEQLAVEPVHGVVLAHEVLDALAVERFEHHRGQWCRQRVQLRDTTVELVAAEQLSPAELETLVDLGLEQPGEARPEGWCSELHSGLGPWLSACGSALASGWLLVIDYALEAWRYYAPARASGTLMAYRGQRASADPLLDPGHWDLTAHLCTDSLDRAALLTGWHPLGQCRQGEALLALGLAQALHALSAESTGAGLGERLQRREALLRLVDPAALGDFRWLVYGRGLPAGDVRHPCPPLFLREPPLP